MNIALSSSDEGELPDLQKRRHRSDEGGDCVDWNAACGAPMLSELPAGSAKET
jgi:hypothetical protein